MINVSRIVNNPNFSQSFNVTRSTGAWVSGRFQSVSEELEFYGSIQPLTTRDIQMLPFGDTITGGIKVYSQEPLHVTRLNDAETAGAVSDEITWNNENYKVVQISQYSDYGFYKAIAVRKRGA